MSSNNLNAAGAGAGPARAPREESPKRKHFKLPALGRSESFFGTELAKFQYNEEHPERYAVNYPNIRKKFPRGIARHYYEKHDAPLQCDVILGPADEPGRVCYLCGFPILGLSRLRDEEGNLVFNQMTPMLDKGSCDHVLPVKLAHAVLKLLHFDKLENLREPLANKLLHTELEYTHFFCNAYKSNEYFITLPLGSRNLCDLEIKTEIIDKVLQRNFDKERGGNPDFPREPIEPGKKPSQYSRVTTIYKGRTIKFRNLIHAYCFSVDPERFSRNPDAYCEEVWKPAVKAMIIAKMERVIRYIKEADGCETNSPGVLFSGIQERLAAGLKDLEEGTPKNPQIKSLKEPYSTFVRTLQRRPSIENIFATTNIRPLPAFSAPPYSGYQMVRAASPSSSRGSPVNNAVVVNDVENLFAAAAPAARPRASRRRSPAAAPAAAAPPLGAAVERAENALEAVNALASSAAAAAAGAGAGAGPVVAAAVEEARGDYIEAVASELHRDSIAFRTRGATRKQGRITNYFSQNAPAAPSRRKRGFAPKPKVKKPKKNSNSNYEPNE